jgi:hypothetical protein
VLQVCGSLLLMGVRAAIAKTACDVCVVRWTEAVPNEPTDLSVQGRRGDVVAELPAGAGLAVSLGG